MFGFDPTEKFKLWAGGIATLVIIIIIFGGAWYIRELQIENTTLETRAESAEALAEYRNKVIQDRNALLAARDKNARANRAFLARQAESRERLTNDAEVDSTILGPDYFNSLQRPY